MDDLKTRLKTLRKANGLSMDQLAQILDTQQSRISDIEAGRGYIKADDLPKYAEALKTTVSYLSVGYDPDNEQLADLGLSNNTVNILREKKDSAVPVILSSIIEHRLFIPLIRNIEILSKPKQEFNKMFTKSVLLHLASDLPYVDSPEQIRSAYMYQTVKLFEDIIESITQKEENEK